MVSRFLFVNKCSVTCRFVVSGFGADSVSANLKNERFGSVFGNFGTIERALNTRFCKKLHLFYIIRIFPSKTNSFCQPYPLLSE